MNKRPLFLDAFWTQDLPRGGVGVGMSRRMSLLLGLVLAICSTQAARAAQSPNVETVASIPAMKLAIAVNFIGETMFVSTAHGVYAYDVSRPESPQLVGALPMFIWENEDMDVDPVRKRLFISRDPRGFTTPATPGSTFPYGAVHVIDVSDPRLMKQVGFFLVPAGHTTTCVNACDYVWTAGPYANPQTQPELSGRPIYATDVRDPANPVPCPAPIDVDHFDGASGYVHDVQVDAAGIAWVSGEGGLRGYWTAGEHRNPLTGAVETATPCDPIPYGGAGSPESATPSRFMHNSWRDANADPDVVYATEENIVADCATSGRFAIYDVADTLDGRGWTSPKTARMKVLDTWTPEAQEGSTGCASAHYFASRGDGLTVNAFYEQGVRFLDVSDPTDIRQVGYFVNPDSNTWAAYWHDGLVYVADSGRGIDVLRFNGAPQGSPAVTAPAVVPRARALRFSRSVFGGLCPLPA
jgi:hypothetical protein